MRMLLWVLLFSTSVQGQLRLDGATASFQGSLPPKPVADLNAEQIALLRGRVTKLSGDFEAIRKHPRAADADIFLKAVRYAIEFREWYDEKAEDGVKKASVLLDEAEKRILSLKKNQMPWMQGSGQKILGFYSKIDDSAQPYGVEIPEGLDFGQGRASVPMWVWLHGRGDKTTDIHFIYNRHLAKKPGQFQPKGTIVIHPFGRYCNGWKSAGETDVFEARDDASSRFNIDQNRVAIAGFSMGGAGAWHIGAHFSDQWACVHAGAGFVDVKRYQKITPEKMPPWYEQKLWGVYDVPNYARNFGNVPLVVYSGELDPQRDAASYMIDELDKVGLHPPHCIGPGMGHQYHPEVIKEVQERIEAAVSDGRDSLPNHVVLQTRTLAYSRMHWLEITAMENQWEEALAEATWDRDSNKVEITTKNVNGIAIHLPELPNVLLNGVETLTNPSTNHDVWSWQKLELTDKPRLTKQPKLQGPIDDGFKSRFIVVTPDRPSVDQSTITAVDQWVQTELAHFLVRWRSLMRGDVLVRTASEVTELEIQEANLSVWGTPKSNSLLRKIIDDQRIRQVLSWNDQVVKFGNEQASSDQHVPVFCYPNPLNPARYVIINSGLTFREAHDKTNSLQNPKLPDWAILDISQKPNLESAGKVVAADFFDANWNVVIHSD